jgi:hypothetical protein
MFARVWLFGAEELRTDPAVEVAAVLFGVFPALDGLLLFIGPVLFHQTRIYRGKI